MKVILLVLLLVSTMNAVAQDTFSIVAVDSVTGEVGSAGASCLGMIPPIAPRGAQLIADVIPGKGAINTQAHWIMDNQVNAHARLAAGNTPQMVIDWLVANDIQGTSSVRQYGVIDLYMGHPRVAAFTGVDCSDYKGHVTGVNYSIQGNILSGRQILDSMEARFNTTNGSLADKLMGALQGANVTGADTRCAPHGISSLSSFIRVARATDSVSGTYYLDLYMSYENNVTGNIAVDPIDSLQTLYNSWQSHLGIGDLRVHNKLTRITYDKNMQPWLTIENIPHPGVVELEIIDAAGRSVHVLNVVSGSMQIDCEGRLQEGIYLYRVTCGTQILGNGRFVQTGR